VGAHFASLESNVQAIAQCLDCHPNLAIDTSGLARLIDCAAQDRMVVRDFFIKYANRILFGTDMVCPNPGPTPDQAHDDFLAEWRTNVRMAMAFFETDETVVIRGRRIRGIGLPDHVLEKIFCENARHWYPGLD